MVIRGLILLWVMLLSHETAAQALKVDSVEVSIEIPYSLHRDQFVDQDTLIEESAPKILTNLMLIDSLYPEKHSYSQGRINFLNNKPYNKIAQNISHHHNIIEKLLFEAKGQHFFNPYSLSLHWPAPPKYKPFAFSLKYRNRDYGYVSDFKSFYDLTSLEKYQSFLQHPLGSDTLMPTLEKSPVKKAMDQLTINEPENTDALWSEIPDPPELSSGNGHIENLKANDSFQKLLIWDNPETKRQLDKRAEMQKKWIYGGTENIQFSQAFIENWVKGGENSIALLSDLRLQARYVNNNVEWESYAIHKLGVLSSDDQEGRVNDDLIELNTKYGLSAGRKWFYSGLFNFRTQFFNGYESDDEQKENPVSGFLAPGYMTFALGMDYKEDNFTLMLMPLTSRATMVLDTVKYDQTRYKIDEDKKLDNMGGASLINNFEWEISDDFNLSSKFDFFYEYMRRDNQVQAEWELILDMNINVFLSTRVSTYLRYYSNESEYIQLKENLSISFNYRF